MSWFDLFRTDSSDMVGENEEVYDPSEHTFTDVECDTADIEFDRVTVELTFVRGGTVSITYDEFDGRLNFTGLIRKVEDGVYHTARGNVQVERLCRLDDVSLRTDSDETISPVLKGVVHSEVTTINVASRQEVSRELRVARVPYKREIERREGRPDIVESRSCLVEQTGEMELEVDECSENSSQSST